MEKFFRPKIFVVFCLLLILVWLGLQYVSNTLVSEAAKEDALEVFDWKWPGQVSSNVEITNVSVLSRSENEARVKVKAKQTLTKLAVSEQPETNDEKTSAQPEGGTSTVNDTACVLTLYRSNRKWVLGKVEFD